MLEKKSKSKWYKRYRCCCIFLSFFASAAASSASAAAAATHPPPTPTPDHPRNGFFPPSHDFVVRTTLFVPPYLYELKRLATVTRTTAPAGREGRAASSPQLPAALAPSATTTIPVGFLKLGSAAGRIHTCRAAASASVLFAGSAPPPLVAGSPLNEALGGTSAENRPLRSAGERSGAASREREVVVTFPSETTTASRENVSLKFDHATRPHGTMTLAAAVSPSPVAAVVSRGAQVDVAAAVATSPLSCASDLDRTYLLWFWWNRVSSYAR